MTLDSLQGLTAADRTLEEQNSINQLMGRDSLYSSPLLNINMLSQAGLESAGDYSMFQPSTFPSNTDINQREEARRKVEAFRVALESREKEWGVYEDFHDAAIKAEKYIDKIANSVSSYYKRFKGTPKLAGISERKYKWLASQYDARKDAYGEDNANIWLNGYFQDLAAENQSGWEKAFNALGHFFPAMEGSFITAFGMAQGAVSHIGRALRGENDDNLNWWDSFVNDVLDNPTTRLGNEIERSGSSYILQGIPYMLGLSDTSVQQSMDRWKDTINKYNPEGIARDVVIDSQAQQESIIDSNMSWQALRSGGFTLASMMMGAGEAKIAEKLFPQAIKGLKALNSSRKLFKTEEGLTKAIEGLRKIQKFVDWGLIPGAVGSVEGAMEGLNTKIEVEREAENNIKEFYQKKIDEEAQAFFKDPMLNPNGQYDLDTIKSALADKYKGDYDDAMSQAEWAASKAGIHNFYINSLINGMLNSTLKAGLMAPRVQEALKNSRLFGWAFNPIKYGVNEAGEATAKGVSKAASVLKAIKEPIGEGFEEYLQNVSSEVFSAAAQSNIGEFIKNRVDGEDTTVTDTFSSDYAAAWTALKGALTSKESIESAVLGAVSSAIGTPGAMSRGYHIDEETGNVVKNGWFDARNFRRGVTEEGKQETMTEYIRRLLPWRSGFMSNYYKAREEAAEAEETAKTLTEWLRNPENRERWEGLNGTAKWMRLAELAAESNDQFSYRKSLTGKTINDILLLSKLKGTKFYDAIMEDLARAAGMEAGSEEANSILRKIRTESPEYADMSDEEIIERIKKNAEKRLDMISNVEQESKRLDGIFGRIDEDTKQSLIFGKLMRRSFQERKEKLEKEEQEIRRHISSTDIDDESRGKNISDELRRIILTHGSIKAAQRKAEKLKAFQKQLEEEIKALEAIDSEKRTEAQQKSLDKKKSQLEETKKDRVEFEPLYKKNEEGEITDELDPKHTNIILTEEEIMDLDPVLRSQVLLAGTRRLYNATHQNRQKIDRLKMEISELEKEAEEIQEKIDGWTDSSGKAKKHHNKQVIKARRQLEDVTQRIEDKKSDMAVETGDMDNKAFYTPEQQAIIDSLVDQGTSADPEFLDKIVDIGRLQQDIDSYGREYMAVLSNPEAFRIYAWNAREAGKTRYMRRRAERIANIEDFEEYAREVSKVVASSSDKESRILFGILRAVDAQNKSKDILEKRRASRLRGDDLDDDGNPVNPSEEGPKQSNYDRLMESIGDKQKVLSQLHKNGNLTSNDVSLIQDAIDFLISKGIKVTDGEAANSALAMVDDEGITGGEFRKWVEEKNAYRPLEQRTVYTSVGELINHYKRAIDDLEKELRDMQYANPSASPSSEQSRTAQQPAPKNRRTSPVESQDLNSPNGEVNTNAQRDRLNQRLQNDEDGPAESPLEDKFRLVTTNKIAKLANVAITNIKNYRASDESKNRALQALEDIASSDERFDSLEELLDAVDSKVQEFRDFANNTDGEESKIWEGAAGALQKARTSMEYIGKKGTPGHGSSRATRGNANSGFILTANIDYLRAVGPESWPVTFYDKHRIKEWLTTNYKTITRDTPVYFITNSDWAAEAMNTMENYSANINMPIVAAVKVGEESEDLKGTTAILIAGQGWFQPIGILPSSDRKTVGASRTGEIRQRASRNQGCYLVTENGVPGGNPLVTNVHGENFVVAYDVDTGSNRTNTVETNNNILSIILDTLTDAVRGELLSMSREEMLADQRYIDARERFIDRLVVENDKIYYVPESFKPNEPRKNKILVTKRELAQAINATGQTLEEVLKKSLGEDRDSADYLDSVVKFNKHIEAFYKNVIRPLYKFFIFDTVTRSDGEAAGRTAKIVTKTDLQNNPNIYKEEIKRIQRALNGYIREDDSTSGISGMSDYLYSGTWRFEVELNTDRDKTIAGDTEDTSITTYNIYLTSSFPKKRQLVGTLQAKNNPTGEVDIKSAKELLRNILFDQSSDAVRDSLVWQLSFQDVKDVNKPGRKEKARESIRQLVDSDLLLFAGSAAEYKHEGIFINAPINRENNPVTSITKLANRANARPAPPLNAVPQAAGAVVNAEGVQIEPNSGIVVEGPKNPVPRNVRLEQAERIVREIIEDSKRFELADNDEYYQVTDGEQIKKYPRVTSIIDGDTRAPRFNPELVDLIDALKRKFHINASQEETVRRIYDKHGNWQNNNPLSTLSRALGVSKKDLQRTVSELKATHNKEKFGKWGLPSTAIGNTVDVIVRDFFAGQLQESYPNMTKEALEKFKEQLENFKHDLDTKHIHIVPAGVVAHGIIQYTDADGNHRTAEVAGTVDLLGYDDDGNFYIFDMKSVRDHSKDKIEREKSKWARQLSMYAALLKQQHPEMQISPDNLKIIPINVNYDAPMGEQRTGEPACEYSKKADSEQLQTKYRGETEFTDYTGASPEMQQTTLEGQVNPGRVSFNLQWQLFSSVEQDLISEQQGEEPSASQPQASQQPVEDPDPSIPGNSNNNNPPASSAPEIVKNGTDTILPEWDDLTQEEQDLFIEEGCSEGVYNRVRAENGVDAENLATTLACFRGEE